MNQVPDPDWKTASDPYRNGGLVSFIEGTDEDDEEGEVMTEEQKEEIMEAVCDLCKWPSEFKDQDDLWMHKCENCRVLQLLEEVTDYG